MKFDKIIIPIIAGVTGSLLTLFIVQSFQYSTKMEFSKSSFPKNAVMAFNERDKCPEGWRAFEEAEGRFVLAAGDAGIGIDEIKIGQEGGSDKLKREPLTSKGLLKGYDKLEEKKDKNEYIIFHRVFFKNESDPQMFEDGSMIKKELAVFSDRYKSSIMPPYIALRLCIKL